MASNIKSTTQDQIEKYGKFQLRGDGELMKKMDILLQSFVAQHRMKLPTGNAYVPCYEIS